MTGDDQKHFVDYWYFAPVALALVMFLLVGTIFEKKIEAGVRSFMENHFYQEPPEEVPTCSDTEDPAPCSKLPTPAPTADPSRHSEAVHEDKALPEVAPVAVTANCKSKSATLLRPKTTTSEVRSI